ncbi:hypothetical protein BH18ACT14_BH18ACT14_13380 [soil metagenome]
MLGFLKELFSRRPKAAAEDRKMRAGSQLRHDVRTAADQDRDEFEAEAERLRSSNRIVGPGG